jgi:hypothetical protein
MKVNLELTTGYNKYKTIDLNNVKRIIPVEDLINDAALQIEYKDGTIEYCWSININ